MAGSNGNSKIPLLVLVGPTAVGKTALALQVARELGTDIISADSAQVYRYLDIGTAKPAPEEQKEVKHHLIDLVDPDQEFSVADYQKAAFKIIEQSWREGKLPFMVGGTGLYIKAVTDRYAFGTRGADRYFRDALEEKASLEGLEKLYAELKSIDPAAARKIHPGDKRRIIRALEVYRLESKPISEQVARTENLESPYQTLIFGLNMDRRKLYKKIEDRVDRMLEQGFLEEVRSLINRGYNREDPGLQILGYRQLAAYLEGKLVWDETVAEIKKQTRNLAKRQLTWFRREKGTHWLDLTAAADFSHLKEIICGKVQDMSSLRANNTP